MNYFKPAAGLIVLIFLLIILFTLFLSEQDEKRRSQMKTESIQNEVITYSLLEQCIDEAEKQKFEKKKAGVSQLVGAINSGYVDSLKVKCLNNMPKGISDPYLPEVWGKKCDGEIEQLFLKEVEIEKNFTEAKNSCNTRFGY